MSILKPTIGQLIDRRALLLVKINVAELAGKATRHFLAERDEIDKELTRLGGPHFWAMVSQVSELENLHLAMWPLVERADAGDESVSAVELHRLNRRRAEVREEIDKLCGEFQGPEKV